MADFIKSGFWQAILFTVIVGIIGSIIGLVLRKKAPVLGAIFTSVPGTFAYFYVWHIRHGIGWLIFAILCAVGGLFAIIGAIIRRQKTGA